MFVRQVKYTTVFRNRLLEAFPPSRQFDFMKPHTGKKYGLVTLTKRRNKGDPQDGNDVLLAGNAMQEAIR